MTPLEATSLRAQPQAEASLDRAADGTLAPARPTRGPLGRVVRVLGSFQLAVVTLALLFLVVLVGTLAQGRESLYDVQRTYFASLGFSLRLFGWLPLPMPGGALLLGVLLVNLLVGGVLRMRWTWAKSGILVTHLGIIVLLVGSAVEYAMSDKGYLRLEEGRASDAFRSYTEWEVAIQEVTGSGAAARTTREWVIPQGEFEDLGGRRSRGFAQPDLPFVLRLSSYVRNAVPVPAPGAGVDGYVLRELPPDTKLAEANDAGLVVALEPRSKGPPVGGLLSSRERYPLQASVDGRRFDVSLRKQAWILPFRVTLQRFVHREHPGTDMPSEFSSYVTVSEGGVERDRHITMNEPLRSHGYTLYQSGWGPQDPSSSDPLYSVFSVVRNPSDRVPIVACAVIFLGLLVQFVLKLIRFLDVQERKRIVASPSVGVAA